MKKILVGRAIASVMVSGLIFLASCEDKVEFNSADTASVQNEAAIDSYFEDTDDAALTMVAADDVATLDHRFKCATISRQLADDDSPTTPHGTIIADFGTGCTDSQGNVRKGKIIVEYKGRRFLPNSTIVTTTDAYSINNVSIEGTRTVTNISGSTEEAPKFNVVLEDGKATWSDGSTATREVNRVREWIRATNPLNDQWNVTGSASGTNRAGKVYEMNITSALVYKRECAIGARVFMAVQGTKELIVNGKRLTIDYGTGDCDRIVTITVDGSSKQFEVKGDI